ncbi:COMM domain-containing protein 2 [Venturia canescens]|uniref:COMM domain-containing protein 2 n=1 Tax=Venturia canescens TaxID=32260 RepID=UPI001C9C6360|nr:COMM domain-containing protein 2 [Venturia canescens]
MLPNLNSDHKKHLLFLAEQTPQVLQDFCKLAIDYLQKGPNLKLYAAAAQKLQVEPEIIRSLTEGLINLLLESSKQKLAEDQFTKLINSLGFQEERETILLKLYETERLKIDSALSKIGLQLPRYHNLEWRFQVQLASRSLLNQLSPIFVIDLMLKTGENSDDIKHVALQSDPSNLLRLSQELESAIADSQSQHARSIKRSIK